MYPNPFSDQIHIIGLYNDFSLRLMDISGRKIAPLPAANNVLDTKALAKGVYLLEIQLPTGALKTFRLLKQ